MTEIWKRNLKKTATTYPADITKQIHHRYAYSGLSLKVSGSLNSKSINKAQNKKVAGKYHPNHFNNYIIIRV